MRQYQSDHAESCGSVRVRLFGSLKTPAGEDEPDEEQAMHTLELTSVNRSQGQEFDVVYLMPVDDGDWEWPWSQKMRLVNVAASRAIRELRVIVSVDLMSEGLQRKLTDTYICPGKGRESRTPPRPADQTRERFVQKLLEYVATGGKAIDETDGTDGAYLDSALHLGEKAAAADAFGFHQSALRSIFDTKSALYRSYPDRAQAGEWATELCVETALAGMEPLRERKAIAYRNVRIADLLTGEDRERLERQDAELQAYVDKGAHFDFVVCDRETGAVLLALEVDGVYHRFGKEDQDPQTARDRQKDAVARDVMRASLCRWQRDDPQRMDGSFTFVRVPTDGSTYWETDRMKELGGAPDGSFTLDELIRRRLAAPAEPPRRFRPVTITKLAKALGYSRDDVQETLRELQYLRETAAVAGLPVTHWAVTRKAQKELGLVQQCAWDETKAYTCPCYPRSTWEWIGEQTRKRRQPGSGEQ